MKWMITTLTCTLLIAFGYGIYSILIKTAPKAEIKRPEKQALLIETENTLNENTLVTVELAGIVKPDLNIDLKSRVSGEINMISDNFIPGGILKKGDLILSIESIDYDLALTNALSQLQTAEFNYEVELGKQEIAKREWSLLNKDSSTAKEKSLALRKPHLTTALSSLQAAKANVKLARLNLERTKIYSPFDALTTSDNVSIGSQINPQMILGNIVGIDRFFVEAFIPLDRIKWIKIPGSTAIIKSNTGDVYNGKVIRLSGALESKGRMGKIIISVENPLGEENNKPLLIDEYVKVNIKGTMLNDICRIPRKSLREKDSVWVNIDGKLNIVPVDVIFKENETVLVKGLPNSSQLIISDIAAPIPGRLVRNIKEK